MSERYTSQQLFNRAPIGSLFKGARNHGGSTPNLAASGDGEAAYLKLVRQCPCLKCGMDPAGEAAHIRMASGAHGKASGIGKKPQQEWTIPLCASCHREDKQALHRVGEPMFFELLGLNPFNVCEKLWSKRGDLVAMRAVVFNAQAEREAVNQFRGIGRMGKK